MMNIASPYFATDSIQSHRKGDFKSERYEVPSSQRSSYYGMLPEGVIDVDAPRFATPAYDPTYAMSIYRMKKKQETAFIQADVVCRMVNGMQTEITRNMRITLIDWLVRVAIDYRLESSTYALAIQYLDSALNLISVKKQDFQLLGCACLWLAAKLEELQPPQVDNLTYAAENCFDAEHLVLYEQKLLRIFEFKAAMPTRYVPTHRTIPSIHHLVSIHHDMSCHVMSCLYHSFVY